jgi:hypothetical protein
MLHKFHPVFLLIIPGNVRLHTMDTKPIIEPAMAARLMICLESTVRGMSRLLSYFSLLLQFAASMGGWS